MESIQVYTAADVDTFCELYLSDAERGLLDPILDKCAEIYKNEIPMRKMRAPKATVQ